MPFGGGQTESMEKLGGNGWISSRAFIASERVVVKPNRLGVWVKKRWRDGWGTIMVVVTRVDGDY